MSKVTKTRIYDDEKEYTFELYENTEPINIGNAPGIAPTGIAIVEYRFNGV